MDIDVIGNDKKSISIIGTVGLPAKYGGWETMVDNIIGFLATQFDVTVFCSSKRYDEKIEETKGVKLEYVNLDANGVQSIAYDFVSMLKSLRFADTLLILGISGCIFLPVIKLIKREVKIVVNIDGLEWKRDKWSKFAKSFLKLSEKFAVKYSDVVVADNLAIKSYVMEEYGCESVFIAFGGDQVKYIELTDSMKEKYSFTSKKYAFSVCRIEPENNIHVILQAFSQLPDNELVIVGNWDNSAYGKQLINEFSSVENIHLLDPIYDQERLNELRSNCDIYIHGHSAGGTNPSLVEAMSLGLPILAYDVIYNRETTGSKALYFCDEKSLINKLKNIDRDDLKEVSQSMEIIAENEYRWEKIAGLYIEALR